MRTSTPVMGWNSYNYYNCYPNETIMRDNAAGLVKLGFNAAGYTYVTTDCGWNSDYRDSSGHLVWNATTFPSGVLALREYIHNLNLKFGVYSGAGHFQCGSTDQPASLGESLGRDGLRTPLVFGRLDEKPILKRFPLFNGQVMRQQTPECSRNGVRTLSSEFVHGIKISMS